MILNRLFSRIAAQAPLIAPHFGHEAELLIQGKKPIGLFSDTPHPSILDIHPNIIEETQSDIQRLMKEVEQGRINFTSFSHDTGEREIRMFFFCQPGLEAEMHELAAGTLSAVSGADTGPVRDQGEYLGYRERDIRLFQNGGYSSLPFGVRQVMQWSDEYRRTAYINSLVPDAEP